MINDIARFPSLRAALRALPLPGAECGDGSAIADTRTEIAGIEAKWTDADLLRAYRQADGQEADMLLAEIEQRKLHG